MKDLLQRFDQVLDVPVGIRGETVHTALCSQLIGSERVIHNVENDLILLAGLIMNDKSSQWYDNAMGNMYLAFYFPKQRALFGHEDRVGEKVPMKCRFVENIIA